MWVVIGVVVSLILTLIGTILYAANGKIKTFVGNAEKKKKNLPIYYDFDESVKFLEKAKGVSEVIDNAKTCVMFSDIPHRMKYHSTKQIFKNELHNGQLKLFLTELEFITECLDLHTDPCIVIYSGSAPSNKIAFLQMMFPNSKFVLVDPREHYIMYPNFEDMYSHMNDILYFQAARSKEHDRMKIRVYGSDGLIERSDFHGSVPDNISEVIELGKEKIYIIEDYYTTHISKLLQPLTEKNKVLFISDIRSKTESEDNPTDLDVIWNSALMYNWIEVLKPAKFMIKFRTPYGVGPETHAGIMASLKVNDYMQPALNECKLPLLENIKSGKFSYIKADHIYVQAFAGPTSTESRIIASKLELEVYDCDEYNDKYFYYNRIHRAYGYHTSHEGYLDQELGIDRCGDCAIMCHVFSTYFSKYKLPDTTTKTIGDLLKVIRRNLKFGDTIHGRYFRKYKDIKDLVHQQKALTSLSDSIIVLADAKINFKPVTLNDAINIVRLYQKFKRREEIIKRNIYILYIKLVFIMAMIVIFSNIY